jgi:RNA polymerase sigma factor (sigma-70 family)
LSEKTDNQLALKAAGGDPAAFELIYNRHAAGVAKALASFAGTDRDVLDDLTQEVFFRVVDGLKSYKPERPFANWLYTVALNVGRNYVRSRSKLSLVDRDKLESIPDNNTIAGSELAREVVETRAMRLVSELPGHLREVVALRISSEMPFGHVGEVLGIPEGTARRRMHEAMAILREKMGVTPVNRRAER